VAGELEPPACVLDDEEGDVHAAAIPAIPAAPSQRNASRRETWLPCFV
jgi:hypothetical protein